MPITFNTRPEHNLTVFVHTGEVSDDEFLAFYKRVFQSGAFDPSMNLLVDLREADSRPRSPEVLRQLAGIVQKSLEIGRASFKRVFHLFDRAEGEGNVVSGCEPQDSFGAQSPFDMKV